MADTSAMADIRGIDIDKLVKGFADEQPMMKSFVQNATTSAREIRWYQKTSGFLTGTTTTDLTGELIRTASKSIPTTVEQSWTRQTSYVKKYFVESPLISIEDLKDTDVDILATNVRDLVRAVQNQVDRRIYYTIGDDLAETGTLGTDGAVTSVGAVADGWNDPVTGDPIEDIMLGKVSIRNSNYDAEGAVILLNPADHKNLMTWLINVKGSSIPGFSSEKVKSGVVMELLGCKIVVSSSFLTDYAVMFVPQRAVTWKQFMPITSVVIDDAGIGKKIRCWEQGEALLTDPNACYGITDLAV